MARTLISIVQELAHLDSSIARAGADKKKLENRLVTQRDALSRIHREASDKINLLETRRAAIKKEEKSLKDDREKVADRRKGLSSHNNYKVQQAAEKELEYTVRQINLKEEALIKTMSELEEFEKEVEMWRTKFNDAKATYEATQKEIAETIPVLDERVQRAAAARQELIAPIDKSRLTLYERARSRFPTEPVVPVNSSQSCSGCFMNLGPQTIVEINRGETLVKCPGCNRILFVQEGTELASPST